MLKKGGELGEAILAEQLDSILGRLFIYPPIDDEKETEIQKIANRGPWAKINAQVQHEINQIGVITENLEKTTAELKEQVRKAFNSKIIKNIIGFFGDR